MNIKVVLLLTLLYSFNSYTQNLPSQVAFTTEEIVKEKIDKVNQKNNDSSSPQVTISFFKSAESSQGTNLASIIKAQQVGIDLNSEGEGLRSSVLKQQQDAGVSDPQGCGDPGALSEYQSNMCVAADSLQVIAVETISTQSSFRETADRSYETMADTSSYILDSSNTSQFSADDNGLPTQSNILYPGNQTAIENFKKVMTSLNSNSEYKGLKFNTKKDYFYLDGKKYSSSILYSKDAMLKAGINKSIANFVYKMLGNKSKSAQDKIAKLLKQKGLYNGKDWSIVKYNHDSDGGFSAPAESAVSAPEPAVKQLNPAPGEVSLSSSLVEEETLYKQVNGVAIGLSSDDIFKMISRRYRESDRRGFFHNSSKK